MEKRILDYMRMHRMIKEGDVVCVGCSGGADSLFLLEFLRELCGMAECGPGPGGTGCIPRFRLSACHVDHMLRGKDSDADRAFVEEFCSRRGIPLYIFREDVALAAKKGKTGLEEAGRQVRREAYEKCVREKGVTKIALAHHADDQAETVLFQLARGSALAGMGGVRPVSGYYIRPLLNVRKPEICEALVKRGLTWREDASNAEDDYSRNRIRHRILPLMENEINPGTVLHLAGAAEHAALAEDFLREEAQRRASAYIKACEPENGRCHISEKLSGEPLLMQRYIVMEALVLLCGRRKDLTSGHVRQVIGLLGGRTGRKVCLPYGIRAVSEYGNILMYTEAAGGGTNSESPDSSVVSAGSAAQAGSTALGGSGITDVSIDAVPGEERVWRLGGWIFRGKLIPAEEFRKMYPGETIPDKSYTKWLNYDKIRTNLTLRTRMPGDYLVIDAAGRHQKIKDYMINRKIPGRIRDGLPLLACGREIYWVTGHRIGKTAEVTKETKMILQITAEHTSGRNSNG